MFPFQGLNTPQSPKGVTVPPTLTLGGSTAGVLVGESVTGADVGLGLELDIDGEMHTVRGLKLEGSTLQWMETIKVRGSIKLVGDSIPFLDDLRTIAEVGGISLEKNPQDSYAILERIRLETLEKVNREVRATENFEMLELLQDEIHSVLTGRMVSTSNFMMEKTSTLNGERMNRARSDTLRGIIIWEYSVENEEGSTWMEYAMEVHHSITTLFATLNSKSCPNVKESVTIESMYGRGTTGAELTIAGEPRNFNLGTLTMKDNKTGVSYPMRRRGFQSQAFAGSPSLGPSRSPDGPQVPQPFFDLGIKFKDGWLWKYAGGYRNSNRVQYAFNWTRRWFVVKEHYLAYYKEKEDEQPQGRP